MTRDEVIATLQAHAAELRRRGVRHVAVFGSVARGDARPDSDIDILVDVAPEAPIDLFGYIAVTQFLEDLFPVPVDVANHDMLRPTVRPHIEQDAVYAF